MANNILAEIRRIHSRGPYAYDPATKQTAFLVPATGAKVTVGFDILYGNGGSGMSWDGNGNTVPPRFIRCTDLNPGPKEDLVEPVIDWGLASIVFSLPGKHDTSKPHEFLFEFGDTDDTTHSAKIIFEYF